MNMLRKGFTLIELLVVIAVIGLLSSIVLASLNTARERARDTYRTSSLVQLRSAIETYYSIYGVYPQSCNGSGNWGGDAYGTPCPTDYINGLAPTYISELPRRPGTSGSFIYRSNSTGSDYKLIITGVDNHNPSSSLDDPGYTNCTVDRANSYAVYSSGARCW